MSTTADGATTWQALELAAARAGLRGERAREFALGLRQAPGQPHPLPVDEVSLRDALKRRRRF